MTVIGPAEVQSDGSCGAGSGLGTLERTHDDPGGSAVIPDSDLAPQQTADELPARLRRIEVQRGPSSIPGREIVQVLTEIPVGVESGWHTHPGEEVGYILAGTVEMSIENRSSLLLQAGDGFLIPPRTPHNARDVGAVTGQMLSTYLVEIGVPLATLTGQRPTAAERATSSSSSPWSGAPTEGR